MRDQAPQRPHPSARCLLRYRKRKVMVVSPRLDMLRNEAMQTFDKKPAPRLDEEEVERDLALP